MKHTISKNQNFQKKILYCVGAGTPRSLATQPTLGDWGLGIEIGNWGLRLGIGDQGLGIGIGIGIADWAWELGMGIGDRELGSGDTTFAYLGYSFYYAFFRVVWSLDY